MQRGRDTRKIRNSPVQVMSCVGTLIEQVLHWVRQQPQVLGIKPDWVPPPPRLTLQVKGELEEYEEIGSDD